MEKLAPGIVYQRAVGLEIVFTPHMGRAVLLLQRDDSLEEIESEKGRFATLPGEDHLLVVLTFKVLADECLKHCIGHAPLFRVTQQLLLGEVVAVGAVEVAERAGGFHHHMHAPHRLAPIDAYLAWCYVIRHATHSSLLI